jgi:hypothetical protein
MKPAYKACSGSMGLAALLLAGCATDGQQRVASEPSWTKYTVTGSRIPRGVDRGGLPRTGTHVVTITDEQLQESPGMLLGEKLGNGFSR